MATMRRRFLCLALPAVVAIALAATYLLLSEPRIGPAALARIKKGMTPEEVSAMLGEPGIPVMFAKEKHLRDYWVSWANSEIDIPAGATLVEWEGDGGKISVIFDRDQQALDSTFKEYVHAGSLRGRLYRWLGML
jgi:hypothetical protein